MKVSRQNRINTCVYENARSIIQREYQNDERLTNTIIKCIFHNGIVESLSEADMLDSLVFHGGTCLQRIYNSDRMSEDLDFCVRRDITSLDAFSELCTDFRTILTDEFAEKFNIDREDIFIREPKNTLASSREGDVCTWRIGILIQLGEARQVVKIDVENRKAYTHEKGLFRKLPGDRTSTKDIWMNVETRSEILANKFISIFQRARLQVRDLYDFGYLMTSVKELDHDMVCRKIESRGGKDLFLQKIADREKVLSDPGLLERMRTELGRFIPSCRIDDCICDDFVMFTVHRVAECVREYTRMNHGTVIFSGQKRDIPPVRTSEERDAGRQSGTACDTDETSGQYAERYVNTLTEIQESKARQIQRILHGIRNRLQAEEEKYAILMANRPGRLSVFFNTDRNAQWLSTKTGIERKIENLRKRYTMFDELHRESYCRQKALQKIQKRYPDLVREYQKEPEHTE